MKVFISGASGFLGSAVTAELSRKGNEVIGLARDGRGASIVKASGGKPIIGDLLKGGAWCDAIKNVDKVVSLTQPVSFDESVNLSRLDEYGRKHAESVTNLIKAASEGKAKAVVVSYHTMCFGDRQGKWVNDFDSVNPVGFCKPMSGSFDSIARVGEDAGLPLVNIYPALVYGDGNWFKLIVKSFLDGKARVVEPGNNYLTLISVEDAAALYALATEKLHKDENLILADDRPVMQRTLMDFIADMLDKSPAPSVGFDAYARQYGHLMAETMASSIRVQGMRAMDLLGYIPKLRSYETGIPYALKSMGIEPRKRVLGVAA